MTVSEGFAATAVVFLALTFALFMYAAITDHALEPETRKNAHAMAFLFLAVSVVAGLASIWTGVMLS